MRKRSVFLISLTFLLAGCTGFSTPSLTDTKPYAYMSGGAPIGRDQIANRWLVAEKAYPIKGKEKNTITTLLGEPSNVKVLEHRISEDWYFNYLPQYKINPNSPVGSFVVRFYRDKVIDVVKLS